MINNSIRTVVFLGPDGAGKTTLLGLVEDKLASLDIDFKRYYFAPGYLKRYRPSGSSAITTNPHEGRQYGIILSLIKITLMLFEFNMGLSMVKRRNELVLFDRFIHDLLVDPRRYRLGRIRWWMRVMLRFAPRADLYVTIIARAELIQARKQEVTLEETERQICAYAEIARQFPRALVVVNEGPAEASAQQIIDEILRG